VQASAAVIDRLDAENPQATAVTRNETMIAGLAVGLATQGMKPVAEAQFEGFIFPMFDHIYCHAARFRNRTRGRMTCPLVLRAPWGGGIRAPEHHSDAPEAMFAHVPGLRVVIPSSPARAYGLLLAAIRDPDPVIFFEPKRVYRAVKMEVPDERYETPLSVGKVVREGDHVTVVAWGAMLYEALTAGKPFPAGAASGLVFAQPALEHDHHPDHHAVIAGVLPLLHGKHVVEVGRTNPAAFFEIRQAVSDQFAEWAILCGP